MIPNLLEATQEYWQKLDELEKAYQQGEISIEEVDNQVTFLMKELAQKRQNVISYLWESSQIWLNQQRETIGGLIFLGIVFYLWLRF
jgi:hypothetical protein